jgi:H+-translocating diphosphatase
MRQVTDENSTHAVILLLGIGAVLWALINSYIISLTPVESMRQESEDGLIKTNEKQTALLVEIYEAIRAGAHAFLVAEYKICIVFCLFFWAVIVGLVAWGEDAAQGWLTGLAFALGALTSIISGYIGMTVAVYSNVRTTINAQKEGFSHCFNTAFRAGSVMGFALNGLGLLVLYLTLCAYRAQYAQDNWDILMECISGYGLGGSTIAMFGRVGGGIYTKAADVGADLVGKVVHGIPEDDPRNPATIADNVGDNVGDVAGMGADLFGSFAEATCACLVIGSQCQDLRDAGWGAIMFPLIVSAFGLVVCFVTSFVATHIYPVTTEHRVELALRLQLILSTLLMIPATAITISWLPESFTIDGVAKTFDVNRWDAFVCVVLGVVGGLVIGLVTEYYTSKEFSPVLELVHSCKTGAATNIIYGLSLGYRSCIIPIFILSGLVYVSFEIADMYGVSLAACGMLSNLATGLTIDAYGPVCDNAGGIAEMAGLHAGVRQKTDALDAAGNTTAAVGKGFAIGSAALVSLALFGAFVTRLDHAEQENNGGKSDPNVREILTPVIFSFLLVGAMIPYWFSALTMKSVGNAAMLMVMEVERQFKANPNLLVEGTTDRPDYKKCVEISTQASLKEMIAPGALVILTPLITGTFFGTNAVCAVLTGSLLSSVMLAISMSNTGGAWDNAKKYIELNPTEEYGAKGGDCHKAAVVGDTVGDPLKDTSGPALNIVMKLMAIISLVFANYFYQIKDGHGLFGVPNTR